MVDKQTEEQRDIYREEYAWASSKLRIRDKFCPTLLEQLKEIVEHLTKAEHARQKFAKACRDNNWLCDCHERRRHMGTWKLANRNKACHEDDHYIYKYPDTPCSNCHMLLPLFDEED